MKKHTWEMAERIAELWHTVAKTARDAEVSKQHALSVEREAQVGSGIAARAMEITEAWSIAKIKAEHAETAQNIAETQEAIFWGVANK